MWIRNRTPRICTHSVHVLPSRPVNDENPQIGRSHRSEAVPEILTTPPMHAGSLLGPEVAHLPCHRQWNTRERR